VVNPCETRPEHPLVGLGGPAAPMALGDAASQWAQPAQEPAKLFIRVKKRCVCRGGV